MTKELETYKTTIADNADTIRDLLASVNKLDSFDVDDLSLVVHTTNVDLFYAGAKKAVMTVTTFTDIADGSEVSLDVTNTTLRGRTAVEDDFEEIIELEDWTFLLYSY